MTYLPNDAEESNEENDFGGVDLDPTVKAQSFDSGSPTDGAWGLGDEEPIGAAAPAYPDVTVASAAPRGTLTNYFGDYTDITWNACPSYTTTNNKDKKVRAFYRTPFAGGPSELMTANLRCGNTKYGYRHLIAGAKDDRFQSYAGARNWRTMAGWSMGWVLHDPWKVTYDSSEEKWCYARPFNFGRTARRIIAAYPTKSKNSCKGNMIQNWINP